MWRRAAVEIPSIVRKQTPHYKSLYPTFKRNDGVGGPKLAYFWRIGWISPTTLRYIKVASDLECMFGSLDNKKIVEIGGGYGGQCAILKARFSIADYTLIDLPSTLSLAREYLRQLNVSDVNFQPWTSLTSITSDLVISSYALSEITREGQEHYVRNVLSHARRGYLLWNENGLPYGSMTAEEMASLIPGSKITRSTPPLLKIDVACNVVLITWG
jgi:putative sugar O-methyltransferase